MCPYRLPSHPALEKADNEALAMRKQAEGLTKEYDRLLEEHAKLQVLWGKKEGLWPESILRRE